MTEPDRSKPCAPRPDGRDERPARPPHVERAREPRAPTGTARGAIIAIDGPAASGKSTVARELARRLGLAFLSSGDLYRAMTWACLRGGGDGRDEGAVARVAARTRLEIIRNGDDCFPRIDGEDPRAHLRDDAVNACVSAVSAVPAVRDLVTVAIREFGRGTGAVIEGRDIASAVFPETPYKFYIDASPEVRQRRRDRQGQSDEIARRDLLDSTRATAPLVVAAGAVVIDSSELDVQGVVAAVMGKLPELKKTGSNEQTGSTGVPPVTTRSTPFFTPSDNIHIRERNLPHWQQDQKYFFVTWRLADSLPANFMRSWKLEAEAWLKAQQHPLSDNIKDEYHRLFSDRLDQELDAGHGSCLLREPACARIVASAMHHFDGQRYNLIAFVVMPNHVHVLFRMAPDEDLSKIIHSWKSFTAHEINKARKTEGAVWQDEYFDRIVRDEDHLRRIVAYIERNPEKAGLANIDVYTAGKVGSKGQTGSNEQTGSTGVPPVMPDRHRRDACAPWEKRDPLEKRVSWKKCDPRKKGAP